MCCWQQRQASGFNSTLVRLRQCARLSNASACGAFQFHIGSIKTSNARTVTSARHTFQFHIGSIKRSQPALGEALRLEFQFHIGSIKTGQQPLGVHRASCFNSTLVRLRLADRALDLPTGGEEFQFHIGSIKTCRIDSSGRPVEDVFQFHIGSIKTKRSGSVNFGTLQFQFHIGSIKTSDFLLRPSRRYHVSIPHWFD